VRATKQVREHRENRNRREERITPEQRKADSVQADGMQASAKAQQKQRINKQYAKAKIQERREERSAFSFTRDFAEKAVEKV
jgi:hypothetical protein